MRGMARDGKLRADMTASFARIALGLVAATLITACAEGGGASPTPEATRTGAVTPPATGSPDQEPADTEAPMPEPMGLEIDGLAEVIATDPLVVRSEPRVADDSEIYENTLAEGDRLFVTDGPIFESGYEWYQVAPVQRPGTTVDEQLPFGYVAAASREGEPWVRALEVDCPTSPTLGDVLALEREERLHCFGDDELTLTGDSQGCGIQDPQTIEPSWFQNPACNLGPADALFHVRFPPEVDPGPMMSGGMVEVTGHFDDPRSDDCTWVGGPAVGPEPPPDHVILMCRLEFVVSSIASAS